MRYNSKNSAVRRIYADVREMSKAPSDQYCAAPLEDEDEEAAPPDRRDSSRSRWIFAAFARIAFAAASFSRIVCQARHAAPTGARLLGAAACRLGAAALLWGRSSSTETATSSSPQVVESSSSTSFAQAALR